MSGPMQAERRRFTELLSNIVDNRGRTCPTAASGTALIATNCIRSDQLYPIFENIRYVSDETLATWFRDHPEPGDILLVTKGSPGRVALVPDPANFCIAQDMVAVRANPAKIYPPYLFAVLHSDDVQRQIENMHVGTLIPHFKKGDFDKLQIPVVDRPMQRFIGDAYMAFSEKIELNRRMNQTLEEIARTIFTAWFVRFDPVRAKAEGRQPDGMDAATAALFPDAFVDSALGPIPAGWSVRPLDKIASFLNGLALQKFPATGDDWLPAIKIAQLRQGNAAGADRVGANVPPDYVVDDGDILFSWSGSLEVTPWCGGRGALNQHLFKVTSNEFPKWFYYQWLLVHLDGFRAIAASKATTMGHIQRKHLTEALVVVPPPATIAVLNETMAPLLTKQIANNLESRTLAEIRDALLPKLLSGEVRVPEAERALAEVGA